MKYALIYILVAFTGIAVKAQYDAIAEFEQYNANTQHSKFRLDSIVQYDTNHVATSCLAYQYYPDSVVKIWYQKHIPVRKQTSIFDSNKKLKVDIFQNWQNNRWEHDEMVQYDYIVSIVGSATLLFTYNSVGELIEETRLFYDNTPKILLSLSWRVVNNFNKAVFFYDSLGREIARKFYTLAYADSPIAEATTSYEPDKKTYIIQIWREETFFRHNTTRIDSIIGSIWNSGERGEYWGPRGKTYMEYNTEGLITTLTHYDYECIDPQFEWCGKYIWQTTDYVKYFYNPATHTTVVQSLAVNMYPNPANEVFYLQLPQQGKKQISVTSLQGQNMYACTTTDASANINTLGWASGLYYVFVTTNQKTWVQKISVVH